MGLEAAVIAGIAATTVSTGVAISQSRKSSKQAKAEGFIQRQEIETGKKKAMSERQGLISEQRKQLGGGTYSTKRTSTPKLFSDEELG